MKKHARHKNNKKIALIILISIFIVVGGFLIFPLIQANNQEGQLEGTIKTIDTTTITIASQEKVYIFNKEQTTFSGDMIEEGANITLTYKGKLIENSQSTQKAKLLSGIVSLPEQEISGTITGLNDNQITFTDSSKEYTLTYSMEEIKSGTVQVDNSIHLTYKGTSFESANKHILSIEITEIERTFTGVIISSNEQAIAIKDEHGNEYLFPRKNVIGDNVIAGYEATLTYKGKLDEQNSDVQNVEMLLINITKVDLGLNDPIIALMQAMSIDEKIGQMFMVRCPEQSQAWFVENYKIGGYILFGRDFENKSAQEVKDNIQSYQDASKIPLLIGTDEEGGTVVRVSRSFSDVPFASPQTLYNQGGMEAILNDVDTKSSFLKSFGINVNFAPVADVSTNPDDFIYDRTFGKSAQENAEYVGQVVWRMKQNNIGSVLKHFPGYGDNGDTHTNICYDERSIETFNNSDFLPFIAGINNGAECILINHNIVEAIDNQRPASLSSSVHQILRVNLGYDKVIVTDDLAMDGVADYSDSNNIAVMAINAGNDILLTSDAPSQIEAVKAAVNDGTISIEQINASVERILRWKHNLGLI